MKKFEKIDQVLLREELRRAQRNKLQGIVDTKLSIYDVKGEAFKVRNIHSELQRAINANDGEKVTELCITINKRLRIIFDYYNRI